MASLIAQPWIKLASLTLNLAAAPAQTLARATTGDCAIFVTMRAIVTAYTSGSIQLFARCGFQNTDTDNSTNAIQLTVEGIFSSLNANELANMASDSSAGAPGVVGNPLLIYPPRWALRIPAATSFVGTVDWYGTWFQVT